MTLRTQNRDGFAPIRPEPPMTTIFMMHLSVK